MVNVGNRPGVRGVLFEVPEGFMSAAAAMRLTRRAGDQLGDVITKAYAAVIGR
jgi:hypothetical protein